MTKEYNAYEYCDSEDEILDVYIAKVIRDGDAVFEFFRNVADDALHDVPGEGKFTCNYHY